MADILLLTGSATLGSLFSLITHLDYVINWRKIVDDRFEARQRHEHSQIAMLGKSDRGWRAGVNWAATYTYDVDCLLVLFWSITLFIGTYNIRIKQQNKRAMSVIFKFTALFLPALMIGFAAVASVAHAPLAFVFLVNAIFVICLTAGALVVVAVLYKYLESRNIFNRIFYKNTSYIVGSSGRNRTVSSSTTVRNRASTDKWLILRFGIIMAILLVFEGALIAYQTVNYQHNRDPDRVEANAPDYSVDQVRVELWQYLPESFPATIAFCIFGTTGPFRREYVKAFKFCFSCGRKSRSIRERRSLHGPEPWLQLQTGPFNVQSTPASPTVAGASNRPWPVSKNRTLDISEVEMQASPVSTAATAVEGPWEAITAVGPPGLMYGNSTNGTTSFAEGPLTPLSHHTEQISGPYYPPKVRQSCDSGHRSLISLKPLNSLPETLSTKGIRSSLMSKRTRSSSSTTATVPTASRPSSLKSPRSSLRSPRSSLKSPRSSGVTSTAASRAAAPLPPPPAATASTSTPRSLRSPRANRASNASTASSAHHHKSTRAPAPAYPSSHRRTLSEDPLFNHPKSPRSPRVDKDLPPVPPLPVSRRNSTGSSVHDSSVATPSPLPSPAPGTSFFLEPRAAVGTAREGESPAWLDTTSVVSEGKKSEG
ncbi:uncharacterized protein K452DRAFT_307203 [Aplosporella prunicola CBS 121167]|uniref:Uncharacterized protein n=1 Tax=Aplosporella prunicola CBS 121167 TaxID=1176127 RepID=A0A6A6BI86_9PEZI|nr:uncharacterized protein K452DRAFT_307203 [Aplosporella prunicola CBS 121167]KAF2143840.1 hypothetical protein K452DRAFT_307203 [Aplosporella prunicola CBS 121167]